LDVAGIGAAGTGAAGIGAAGIGAADIGAVAAPEGTLAGGAITSLPALEPLASLGLSGKASMCTGVPKSCLPFAED
jgi:hypothetical protein